MKTIISTVLLVLIGTSVASADWALYTNKDNKTWFLAENFATREQCDIAAKKEWERQPRRVLGLACQEWNPAATLAASRSAARSAEIQRRQGLVETARRDYESVVRDRARVREAIINRLERD